ncbi:MAG TPA: hypothetical protein VFA50_12030 [Stellaceae bacterium]|nr:hypothetical protein [Stellaceae bacterium]
MRFVGVVLVLLAITGTVSAAAEGVAPEGAVACISQSGLWAYLDDVETSDREALRQIYRGQCRLIGGAHYAAVESRNGVAKILVFKQPGNWNSAEPLYTTEEMLQPAKGAAGRSS